MQKLKRFIFTINIKRITYIFFFYQCQKSCWISPTHQIPLSSRLNGEIDLDIGHHLVGNCVDAFLVALIKQTVEQIQTRRAFHSLNKQIIIH